MCQTLVYTCLLQPDFKQCICSEGCSSSWRCQPSLCDVPMQPTNRQTGPRTYALCPSVYNPSLPGVQSLARRANSCTAPMRHTTVRCIAFCGSCGRQRRVKTPLQYVVVGPERNEAKEQQLMKHGVHITVGQPVPPPKWASRFHLLTFSKIGALALTQFDKVFVFDNDVTLVHNIDHLAFVKQQPRAVWHNRGRVAVEAQRDVRCHHRPSRRLSPSQAEFYDTLLHMNSLSRAVYDGGDQECKFYTWNELRTGIKLIRR